MWAKVLNVLLRNFPEQDNIHVRTLREEGNELSEEDLIRTLSNINFR